jgi:ribonuclease-3
MIRGFLNLLIYIFHKDRPFYFNLCRILGFLPARPKLYRTAFTHKSASVQLKDGNKINNERLEYLGDAILGAIVAEYIFTEFEGSDEGFMTKLRSRIVKRKNLNSMAIKMGIPMMISSHPHPANRSKHLYGNALEALIGAIYLDRGYRKALRFFKNRMLKKHLDLALLAKKDSDYKSQLIEWAQKNKEDILFDSVEVSKTKNIPEFSSVVCLNDREIGRGQGGSKKEAEQQASKVALKGLIK